MSLENVRVVLVRPRGGANVGAVARAMKNMGLRELVLVRPAINDVVLAKVMAVHADDVLGRMGRAETLDEAVEDCGLVVGTTCRDGLYRAAAEPPRSVAPRLVAAAAVNRVALVFGPEDEGLNNDDLKACQQLIHIPSDPGYASLNLAQAVMICCYEIFLAAQTPAVATPELARAGDTARMFQRMRTAFLSIGFLHADNPEHIMFAFRRMLGRAQMEERDVRIVMAMARQIEWFGRGGWRGMAQRHPHADARAADEGDEGFAEPHEVPR